MLSRHNRIINTVKATSPDTRRLLLRKIQLMTLEKKPEQAS